ncbi:MAG TPA: late competence development ComFB family protein [Gemmatimonadales bacterium]|jgi:competence protein ComFB|nr:late competence development ComFB family protein [Gemmatimonadales bacterium]
MIHNRVEEHVQDAYNSLRGHFPEFCGCETCQADVLVYALNRLPARYVASLEGTVITELNLDKQQSRASIDVAVMEAFRKVSAAPRCKRQGNRPPAP